MNCVVILLANSIARNVKISVTFFYKEEFGICNVSLIQNSHWTFLDMDFLLDNNMVTAIIIIPASTSIILTGKIIYKVKDIFVINLFLFQQCRLVFIYYKT